MVTVLGRSSPASTYPSVPQSLLLLGGRVGEWETQQPGEGDSTLPSGLQVPLELPHHRHFLTAWRLGLGHLATQAEAVCIAHHPKASCPCARPSSKAISSRRSP